MTDLTGKVALITASARGIGKTIALRYAHLGADTVINYSGDEAKQFDRLFAVNAKGTLHIRRSL
jgi:3-oxoacyl-[acyl-carrier protein] reductase